MESALSSVQVFSWIREGRKTVSKAVVKEDKYGIYIEASGYIARPVAETLFEIGEEVDTHHHSQTCYQGVGKDETCARGQYLEVWCHTGMSSTYKKEPRKYSEEYEWYVEHMFPMVPMHMSKRWENNIQFGPSK